MSDALLRFDHVSARVGGRTLLRDVVLEVPPGGSLGIVGETGSGKSLSCRAMMGLLDRIGGEIVGGTAEFAGIDLRRLDRDGWRKLRGRRIGLVPQMSLSALDPVRRIGSQLDEAVRALKGKGKVRERSVELLESVEIPRVEEVLTLYPHELSGGMRQRVMIALALAGHPELLIADEATTALDVTIQRTILELLSRLREELGMALLVVTHDLGVVEEICDSVAVMYGGSTVESGTVEQILSAPAHPYTRALIAADPALRGGGEPIGIPGAPPDVAKLEDGCAFAARCPEAIESCKAGALALEEISPGHLAACKRLNEGEG
jgi:oligopeptide/dipeptide ABC transporter ATP-binding protein